MAGVYVHVPFCHAKCAYCDFYSTGSTRVRDMARDVCRAIAHEWLRRWDGQGAPTTLYIGGGTPSILTPELLALAVADIPRQAIKEWTVEVNPEDVTQALAQAYLEMGVNRVSMGVQSMVEEELTGVGRRHTARQAAQAFRTLREAGFANLSVDLIYGLPGQTAKTWRQSVEGVLDWGPEHLSAYALSWEPGTRLWARWQAGKITPASDELVEEMYLSVCDLALGAQMEHYEISNWALPGHRAAHNSSYWDGEAYLGLGPGAVSYDGGRRRITNVPDVKRYLAGAEPDVEVENDADLLNDRILTRLRTADGLDPSGMPDNVIAEVEKLLREGLLSGNPDGRLRVPEDHWLLCDLVIRRLMV